MALAVIASRFNSGPRDLDDPATRGDAMTKPQEQPERMTSEEREELDRWVHEYVARHVDWSRNDR